MSDEAPGAQTVTGQFSDEAAAAVTGPIPVVDAESGPWSQPGRDTATATSQTPSDSFARGARIPPAAEAVERDQQPLSSPQGAHDSAPADPLEQLRVVTGRAANWKRAAITEAFALAAILIVGAVFLILSLMKPNLLNVAQDHGFRTDSGDTTQSVSVTVYGGTGMGQLQSMLNELGFPAGTTARMESTRALDGTLDARGDHVNVTWTYHPDNGLRMVFEVE